MVELTLSLNETYSLAKTAAHGAQLSWGLAEEFAYAACGLSRYNLPGLELLSELLKRHSITSTLRLAPKLKGLTLVNLDLEICPVLAGIVLLDNKVDITQLDQLSIRDVRQPLLLLPFILLLSQKLETQLSYRFEGVEAICDNGQLAIGFADQAKLNTNFSHVKIETSAAAMTQPLKQSSRVPISKTVYENLQAFAANTYAPSSDLSRQGAGANSTDND